MNTLLHVAVSNCVMALALAVAAACVGRWCRRPAVAHGLWLLVLLKLVTPPLVFVPLSWPAPSAPEIAAAPAPVLPPPLPAEDVAQPAPVEAVVPEDAPQEGEVPPAAAEVPALAAEPLPPQVPSPVVAVAPGEGGPWLLLAGTLWLGGAACWFTVALGRIRRFHRLLRQAAPAPADMQDEARTLAARLGIARCPRVWLVPGVVSPMLWAMGRAPRLLLPAGLLERVSGAQRATLLVHELAHLRRGDHRVRILELLVLGLYWWFPLVWWARRELREAEEECCDAWVVWALPDAPRAYATALVETLDFLSEVRSVLPPAASGVGHLHSLRRRLTMIMRGTTPRALTGAGLLALVGLGLLLLPLVPSWAQDAQGRGKGAEQLEKARIELQQIEKDLAMKRFLFEQLRRKVEQEQAAQDLLKAEQERLLIEEQRRWQLARAQKEQGGWKPGAGAGVPGGAPQGLERRLAEMERKLDQVLRELHELRREAAKANVFPPGPRPKGPNVPADPTGPGGRPGGGAGVPGPRPGGPGRPGAPNPPGFPGAPAPGPNPGAALTPAGGAALNPPPAEVKGQVVKIDAKDRRLVKVSLGSDAGLKKNHTLEVYRLRPQPEYLGRLRIEEVTPGEAVGRLLPASGTRSPLEEGDEVSGTIPR